MQCIWSTTARSAFRSHTQRTSAISHALIRKASSYDTSVLRCQAARNHISPPLPQVAHALPRSPPTELIAVWTPHVTYKPKVTPAHISRAACHAVHLALRTPVGGLEDAVLIVNSLRYSTFKHDPAAQLNPAVRDFHRVAVKFEQAVPPRLSSHALLHGLIRVGRRQQASDLAVSMMESGMKPRTKTLETLMRTLIPRSLHAPRKSIPPLNFFPNPRGLGDIVAMARHPHSRLALEIFSVARKTHRHNTRGMLGTLIAICLFNTEIILASLIFAFMVKEWQVRSALVNHFDAPDGAETGLANPLGVSHSKQEKSVPTHEMLSRIVLAIKRIFDDGNKVDADSLGTAIQALANLAVLLDHRQLPFNAISPLLRTLYHCPRVDHQVWIVDQDGETKQICAYTYFHEVLGRLLTDLPLSNKPKTSLPPMLDRRPALPPLDLHACNTLLHYSLRHLLSPAHADRVLKYMVAERNPPLELDNTTYNILLRSATLLQNSAIAEAALAGLATLHGGDVTSRESPQSTDSNQDVVVSELIETLKSLDLTKATKAETTKLLYSLTTQLMHYTSTGHPQKVAALVHSLFPELEIELTPSRFTPAELLLRKRARRGMVVRASRYGPHLFSVLLNALFKSGQTGLAKSLWNMAKRAERRSWDSLNPWVLDTHAYTLMLRCCALEYKRPQCNSKIDAERVRRAALDRGLHHYRTMKTIGREVRAVLAAAGTEYRFERIGKLPQMDALFVNAAIKLFVLSRRPPGQLPAEDEIRSEFEQAKVRLAECGRATDGWTPILQEIGQDIVAAGFAIPPGLRHIFLGRWEEGARKRDRPPHLGPIPVVYPDANPSFHPFIVPSIRTRGLPLSKREKFLRRRERRRTPR